MRNALTPIKSPQNINTENMVIRSPKGSLRNYLDGALTFLAWAIFIYLLIEVFINWGKSPTHIETSPLDFNLSDLATCIAIITIQSGSLLLWAFYNRVRFKGKKRRTSMKPVSDEELMNKFSIDKISLKNLRQSSISIIHHSKEGAIQKISSTVNQK